MKIFFIYYFILGVFYACRTARANLEIDQKDNFVDFVFNIIIWPVCVIQDAVTARKRTVINTKVLLEILEHLKNNGNDNEDNT